MGNSEQKKFILFNEEGSSVVTVQEPSVTRLHTLLKSVYDTGRIYTYGALTDLILDNQGDYLEFGGRKLLPYFLLVKENENERELCKIDLELLEESSSLYHHVVRISSYKTIKRPISIESRQNNSSMPKVSSYLFNLNEIGVSDYIKDWLFTTRYDRCLLLMRILEQAYNKQCFRIYYSTYYTHQHYRSILFDFIEFQIIVDNYFIGKSWVKEVGENIYGLINSINNQFVSNKFFYEKVDWFIPEDYAPYLIKENGIWKEPF